MSHPISQNQQHRNAEPIGSKSKVSKQDEITISRYLKQLKVTIPATRIPSQSTLNNKQFMSSGQNSVNNLDIYQQNALKSFESIKNQLDKIQEQNIQKVQNQKSNAQPDQTEEMKITDASDEQNQNLNLINYGNAGPSISIQKNYTSGNLSPKITNLNQQVQLKQQFNIIIKSPQNDNDLSQHKLSYFDSRKVGKKIKNMYSNFRHSTNPTIYDEDTQGRGSIEETLRMNQKPPRFVQSDEKNFNQQYYSQKGNEQKFQMSSTLVAGKSNKLEMKLPEMNVNDFGLRPLEDESRLKYLRYMQMYDSTLKNYKLTSYLKNKVEKNFSMGNLQYINEVRKIASRSNMNSVQKKQRQQQYQKSLEHSKDSKDLSPDKKSFDSSQVINIADQQVLEMELMKTLSKQSSQLSLKRKISCLEIPKNEEGMPLKLQDLDPLSLQKFQSRSEQERFIKNSKILRDLSIQYQLNSNYYEVSNQFLLDTISQHDFRRLTVAQIDSLKSLVENKQIDCKKDFVSALKEALAHKKHKKQPRKSFLHSSVHDHASSSTQGSANNMQSELNKLAMLTQSPEVMSYKRWTDKMTPRTLKTIMLSKNMSQQKINLKQLKNNKESMLVYANHSVDLNKQHLLSKYIADHQKTLSPGGPSVAYDKPKIKKPQQSAADFFVKHRQQVKNQYDLKLDTQQQSQIQSAPALKYQQNLSIDLSNNTLSKIKDPLDQTQSQKHSLIQITKDSKNLDKIAHKLSKGNYADLFENVYQTKSKVSQDQMQKKNLLLEHVMLEREELEKEKKKNRKKQKRNKNQGQKWWRETKDDVSIDLFQLPVFQQFY
ncbi:UNKNOWN [Stylonychia lemnae]|uniref:Uncharacterized protein n=1 Tax=Stylonychia lemnae TaxID=5949 RepID=A0A078B299_STYLE|nr:UNKNOWN [Stylonychia lemnae]|eukprot:CDW87588.1 UNKNOWN [Stylonychia lemnae]